MLRLTQIVVAVLVCSLVACSQIKIETGTTADEMAQKNEILAKQIRSEWSDTLFKIKNDQARLFVVKNHIDSVSALIIRYGFKIADQWRQGNFGRGEEIEASEMRQVVDAWVAEQKPILQAYEDNMEYGIRLVKETSEYGTLPEEAFPLLDSLASQYYDTYSVVFYPNHNTDLYEEELLEAKSRHQFFMEQLNRLFWQD